MIHINQDNLRIITSNDFTILFILKEEIQGYSIKRDCDIVANIWVNIVPIYISTSSFKAGGSLDA